MVEQGTMEWKYQRAGKFTASRFCDVLARSKKTGEPLKAYNDMLWSIVVERMTGEPIEGPDAFALQWGKDVEPYARNAYELSTGTIITLSEFVTHPAYPFVGASPDGLIGNKGGVEFKCPKNPGIHLERFLSGVPEEYKPQIQGCMWVTGREWWDFGSYDPRMPESHRLLVIRVHRDDAFIATMAAAILEAEERVLELMDKIQRVAA